jgi:hypothetical protein
MLIINHYGYMLWQSNQESGKGFCDRSRHYGNNIILKWNKYYPKDLPVLNTFLQSIKIKMFMTEENVVQFKNKWK